MKTKEEIEQLAESIYHQMFSSNPFVVAESKGYIKGYLQCQENIDNKYTQDDIRMAYNKGCNTTRCEYEKVVPEYIKPMSIEEFIQSLNKQD
jgi:hypothetical protein